MPQNKERPKVFFEMSLDNVQVGFIIMELFADVVPKTAENFRCLCTGERGRARSGKQLHFLDSTFHRIIPGFMCQGGDFTVGNGTGGESIYGAKFADENFRRKHTTAGTLSMANCGPDSNSSQFFICTRPSPHLDGKHVVFGQVIDGMDVLKEVEACGSSSGKTWRKVVIRNCGEIGGKGPPVAHSSQPAKRSRAEEGEARAFHILRKHKDCRKPSSAREKVISCSRADAVKFLQNLREELSSADVSTLPTRFMEAARLHSDCGSAKKGGDLGVFARGRMQKPFEDASFSLRFGELSQVVETESGVHLILRAG
eukprot:TRINITY_DN9042_c0_g1_i1.p1 TRINITY_DN9042_c0_g1~~TRINITY_DN9042_c0_g1_i1.p1  ORF type:complete len:313 (-),score=63.61 TRINITY_DN9042_c0_g1_i1:140-1078(-)